MKKTWLHSQGVHGLVREANLYNALGCALIEK